MLSCAALVVAACSSSKKPGAADELAGSGHATPAGAPGSAGPAGQPAPGDAAANEPAAPPSPDLGAAIDQAFAAAKLTLAPAPAPPPASAAKESGAFLGWSKDGASYLVLARHAVDEEPGREGVGFTLIEVRETTTQQVMETYQDKVWPARKRLEQLLHDERSGDASDVPLALWDAAKPAAEREKLGARFVEIGAPVPGKPRGAKHTSGAVKLGASVRGTAPYKSKLSVADAPYGFSFSWTGFAAQPRDPGGKTRSPGIEIVATGTQGAFPLVTSSSTHTYESLHAGVDESEPSVEGEIRAYWSPAGTHVALNVLEMVDGGHEEVVPGLKTRSFVRALGPQIKVVAAGVSYDRARKAAALIGGAGHPVTLVEQAATPTTGPVVYYRGDAGKAAADAIVKLFPGARAESLAKPGWLDVIVMLGV